MSVALPTFLGSRYPVNGIAVRRVPGTLKELDSRSVRSASCCAC